MRTPLAWLNLVHAPWRTVVVLAGTCLVLVLIFLQLGFLGVLRTNAVLLYDHLCFDLVLVSPEYVSFDMAGSFPRHRLVESQALPGVARAMPLYAEVALWRNPQTRRRVRMRVIGINPLDQPLRLPELESQLDVLQDYDTALIDRRSLPECRPQETGRQTAP